MNPFSGIITSEFKQLFTNAISALLEPTACTTKCTLFYGTTKYEDCANCVYSPLGKKSSNRYKDGGPIPFSYGGICPLCGGIGKRAVESSSTEYVMVIWQLKDFFGSLPVNVPDGVIQTLFKQTQVPNLIRANYIQVAVDLDGLIRYKYKRITEPQPCGLGTNDFFFCNWERT